MPAPGSIACSIKFERFAADVLPRIGFVGRP
jgi:hypothetical protein